MLSDNITTSKKTASKKAALAVLLCVMADAMDMMSIPPNYPLMVTVGAHPSSFPSIGPLGIATAQYLLISIGSLGCVLSNFFFGWVSDRYNSRLSILILMGGTVVATIAKYFAQPSYWIFLFFSFIHSLFGGIVGAANGYMGKLFRGDRNKADTYMSYVMGTMVVSRTLGGLTTLLFPRNLFLPLIPAAVWNLLVFGVAYRFVLDPEQNIGHCNGSNNDEKGSTLAEKKNMPERIHSSTLVNIILGAFLDCIGSLGLTAIAFSPVLFKTFYLDFVNAGQNPIMSENLYRWLYSMLAVAAVPGALMSPWLFKKIGVAVTCVGANVLTGVITMALTFLAQRSPTNGTLVACGCVIFVGFPLTIVSNFTTGPMLDRITPVKRKGFIQGLNFAIYDCTNSIFLFIMGVVSDRNMFFTMWACVAISFLAAFANMPLICNSRLQDTGGANEDSNDEEAATSLSEEI